MSSINNYKSESESRLTTDLQRLQQAYSKALTKKHKLDGGKPMNNFESSDAYNYDYTIIHSYLKGTIENMLVSRYEEYLDEQPCNAYEGMTIDQLLDAYNDYITLYNLFKDKEYKDEAERVMEYLNTIYTGGK